MALAMAKVTQVALVSRGTGRAIALLRLRLPAMVLMLQ